MGTWFDIYPNEDLNGQYFFPDHQDCGWLMHLRLDLDRHANIVKAKSEAFVEDVLNSTQFDHVIFKESGDLLAGLTRQGHIGSRPVA